LATRISFTADRFFQTDNVHNSDDLSLDSIKHVLKDDKVLTLTQKDNVLDIISNDKDLNTEFMNRLSGILVHNSTEGLTLIKGPQIDGRILSVHVVNK
jgi:hypothetical protein